MFTGGEGTDRCGRLASWRRATCGRLSVGECERVGDYLREDRRDQLVRQRNNLFESAEENDGWNINGYRTMYGGGEKQQFPV